MALISFARGMPGPDLLPIAAFGDCAHEALERDGATALQYGPPGGYPPLKQWVAEQHDVDPGRVIVTNGSLQGFAFTARHFVQSGSRFFVEAPCYDRSLSILRKLGAEVEQVDLVEDGLDVDALAGLLRAGDVVYTIPTFQNPSGRTLSLENRRRLLALAAEAGAVVFEDDPYGMLRFEGESIPRLFELSGGSTIFLSSFSKTVAPGIRTGYLILPEELVPAIEELVLSNYVSPAIFVEAALLEFLTSGRFEPNLETVRDGLRIRRDAMLAALEREMPEGTRWNHPEGGYFLWLDLPEGVNTEKLRQAAIEEGVGFIAGPDFMLEGGESSLRLSFASVPPERTDEGVSRIARALEGLRAASPA